MTTEDDFQATLDAHPEDWQTRMVFADWLEDRDDPRADGYRALGRYKRLPVTGGWRGDYWGWRLSQGRYWKFPATTLPKSWWNHLKGSSVAGWESRREAEDAAALAFAKLPAARRAELLTSPAPA